MLCHRINLPEASPEQIRIFGTVNNVPNVRNLQKVIVNIGFTAEPRFNTELRFTSELRFTAEPRFTSELRFIAEPRSTAKPRITARSAP